MGLNCKEKKNHQETGKTFDFTHTILPCPLPGRVLSGVHSVPSLTAWEAVPQYGPSQNSAAPSPWQQDCWPSHQKDRKAPNLHVACARPTAQLRAGRPDVLTRVSERKHVSAGPVLDPRVLTVSMTAASVLSLLRGRQPLRKCWRHKHTVSKLRKWSLSE